MPAPPTSPSSTSTTVSAPPASPPASAGSEMRRAVFASLRVLCVPAVSILLSSGAGMFVQASMLKQDFHNAGSLGVLNRRRRLAHRERAAHDPPWCYLLRT